MNTQDNINLKKEYLEVVTCTYKELCNIKKPVNGRLYHTSDTNEFYFDWANKRQKLSVFSTGGTSNGNILTKTELKNWLKENDYITNLSLADEIVKVIGSPIKNIITLKALEDYANKHLLTKSELNLLDNPLQFAEDIKALKSTNTNFYNSLSSLINEVRNNGEKMITPEKLNSRLVQYVDKAFAESVYLSKEDASIYIDEEGFRERVKGYLKKSEADTLYLKKGDLSDYEKKSDLSTKLSALSKKIWVDQYFMKKSDMNVYEKTSSIDEKLKKYVTGTSVEAKFKDYLTADEISRKYLKKGEMGDVLTPNEVNEMLSAFAKKIWVDQYYMKKKDMSAYEKTSSLNEKLKEYVTNSKLKDYVTKEEINNFVNKRGSVADDTITPDELNEVLSAFAKKMWVDQYYMKKSEMGVYEKTSSLNEKLKDYATISSVDTKLEGYLTEDEASSRFLKKGATDGLLTSDELNSALSAFAKKIWVDQYYVKKSQLSDYFTKSEINDTFVRKTEVDKFLTKTEAEETYAKKTEIPDFDGDKYMLKSDGQSMAKKMWVDQYYLRKSDYERHGNTVIISTEFSNRTQLNNYYASTPDAKQGFYYLKDEADGAGEMWVIINDGNTRMNVNLTTGETTVEFKLNFGGTAATQW